MAYVDPWGGYNAGLKSMENAYEMKRQQDAAELAEKQDARAAEKFQFEMAEARQKQADRDAMRGLSTALERGKEVTTETPNPAAAAYKLQQGGMGILSSSLPSQAEQLDQVPAAAYLRDEGPAGLAKAAVSPMEGIVQKPEETIKQTSTVPFTPVEKQNAMMSEYLKRGMLDEVSKYATVTQKMDEDMRKNASFVTDLYNKNGQDWNKTEAILRLHAPQFGYTQEHVDKLGEIFRKYEGQGGYRFVEVPDDTSPTGVTKILVDAKGKPVNRAQAMTPGEKVAQEEAAKEPYRNTRFEEKLKLEGVKGEKAERMMQVRFKLAKALKQTPNITDDHLDILTEMAENRHLPPGVNSRTAPILAEIYGRAKRDGSFIDFNSLKTDVAAQNKIKQNVGMQEVNANAARKHLDRFERIYDTLGNTSIPVINKVALAFQKGTGAPEGDAAAAVLYEAMTEYAKVISGQTTGQAVTDTATKKANELLAVKDSPEQVKRKMNEFRFMMEEKIAAGKETLEQFTGGVSAVPGGKKGNFAPAAKKIVPQHIEAKVLSKLPEGGKFSFTFEGTTFTGRKEKGKLVFN